MFNFKNNIIMNYKILSLTLGFSVWLLASIAVNLWGFHILNLQEPIYVCMLYLCVLPVLYLIMQVVFKQLALDHLSRVKSAVLMCLPGMFLDIWCVKYQYLVFPELSAEQTIVLGSWILWANFWVLLIGLLLKPKL